MNLFANLKGKIRFKHPLSAHTSFKIGGAASVFFEPEDERDLINCLEVIKKNKIPYFVIGNGTNLLIKDEGFNGIVIKLSSSFFKQITVKNNILTVGAGLNISELLKFLLNTDFSGYEFLAGIPGTIGGALITNAGIIVDRQRKSIGDIIYRIKVLTKKGDFIELPKEDANFGYRKSNLGKYIILEVQVKLNKSKKSETVNRIKDFLSYRKVNHDYSKPNAGCIFRNPSIILSAGALIDRCGLKGMHFGGAMISRKHANFILNFNRATAKDVLGLVNLVKKRVKGNFGIQLREEIKIVP